MQKGQMHVVAPKEASTCRSKGPKVSGSKEPTITSLRVPISKEKSHRWRWWKILSRDHIKQYKAVSRVVKREKEIQEWNEQKLPKVLPGYRGGRLPGRSAKESGREEEEEDENSKEKK